MAGSVLVLGRLFPPGTEEEAVKHSRGMISSAASSHLDKIIKGLDFAFEGEVDILNVTPISSYPRRYDRLFIQKRVWSHSGVGEENDISIDFFNLTAAKNISIQRKIDKYALEWAKRDGDKDKYVIVYTMWETFLKTCVKIKRVCPQCHVCVVVPDLPEYTDLDKSGIRALLYKFIIKRRVRKTNDLSKVADSFVFLTEQMAEYFPVKRPYIVSEGISVPGEPSEPPKDRPPEITAAYTGSFTKKYGIIELLDAIAAMKNRNVRFIICGSGEAYDIVAEYAARDSRIDFRGMVTHSEALEIQKNADILINPRSNDGKYTKYSFPSKIMEYMAAGRPVICFRLDGIPEEYDDFLTYFKSREAMAQQLDEICSLPREKLDEMGRAGAQFVRTRKNYTEFGKAVRGLITKKRFLICADDLVTGGTTTSLLSLLRMIDKYRYDIDLVTPNGLFCGGIPEYVRCLPPAAEQSRAKRRMIYMMRGFALRRALYSRTRSARYPKGLFTLMSGIAQSAASAPAERFYDAAVGYMEGFPDHYVMKRTQAARKFLYVHVNYEGSGLDPDLDKDIFSRADGIAAVSEDCASSLKSVFPECAHKIRVIPNPISAERIREMAEEEIAEKDYAPSGCFNIVTAARLANPHKAIDRAVLNMQHLKKISPMPVKWYVFGSGPDEGIIRDMISQCGVENEFILMGERKNVYPYIKKADIFVLSSRYEGKPMCITEAQILGCVPVVTEYGSARSQIRSGTDGLICENADSLALAEAICGIIKNPQKLRDMRLALSQRELSSGLDDFYDFIKI